MKPTMWIWKESDIDFTSDEDPHIKGAIPLYTEEQLCACKKTMIKKDVSGRKCCHQFYKEEE